MATAAAATAAINVFLVLYFCDRMKKNIKQKKWELTKMQSINEKDSQKDIIFICIKKCVQMKTLTTVLISKSVYSKYYMREFIGIKFIYTNCS